MNLTQFLCVAPWLGIGIMFAFEIYESL